MPSKHPVDLLQHERAPGPSGRIHDDGPETVSPSCGGPFVRDADDHLQAVGTDQVLVAW